jgi:hypothetical protein
MSLVRTLLVVAFASTGIQGNGGVEGSLLNDNEKMYAQTVNFHLTDMDAEDPDVRCFSNTNEQEGTRCDDVGRVTAAHAGAVFNFLVVVVDRAHTLKSQYVDNWKAIERGKREFGLIERIWPEHSRKTRGRRS